MALSLAAGGCARSGRAATDESNQATDGSSHETGTAVDQTDATDKKEGEAKEEAVPVEVVQLASGRIESVLRFSSNLEAENHVQVYSQAARLVRELLVEEGDRVSRNQVLVRLQDEEQRNNLSRVRSQLAKAQREQERQALLFKDNLISEQFFYESTFQMEQLEIAVADAERELGYTEVRAPIKGTVTSRLVKLGDQINVGQHLFDLVDFDSMVARVYIPEKNLPQLRRGLKARIGAQALGDREYLGHVDRIAPVVDPKTGTLKVTVAVGGQAGLRPGLYVDVALVTAVHDEAVLVPKRALVYDQDRVFVYRMNDERRVEKVAVTPVLTDKNHIEPEASVEAGDWLVTAGQAGLKNGALVKLAGEDADADTSDEEGAKEAAAQLAADGQS